MKKPVVEGLRDGHVRGKSDGQQHGTDRLYGNGDHYNGLDEAHNALEGVLVEGFFEDEAFFDGDTFAEEHGQQRRNGHEAEPTQLNQEQDDHLPERAEHGSRINDDEAGDADGRRGHEERVNNGETLPVASGHGEHEKHRAHHRAGGKSDHQNACG